MAWPFMQQVCECEPDSAWREHSLIASMELALQIRRITLSRVTPASLSFERTSVVANLEFVVKGPARSHGISAKGVRVIAGGDDQLIVKI
jgi:hypothetical protein